MRNILLVISLLLCLGSCLPGHNDFSEYKPLPEQGWAYNDVLTFTPTEGDSLVEGTLSVGLRHTNEYPYANLYLEVAYDDTTGQPHVDTLNIELADTYGKWHGKGVGLDFQLTDTVTTHFTRIINHPIKVRHVMRVDTLQGIDQVGIIFETKK